jgi:hypothetical protein
MHGVVSCRSRVPVSEQASLPPIVQETRRPRGGEAESVVSETIPQADADATPAAVSRRERRRGGRLFPAFCALFALIAALVTLAAPVLRPAIAATADTWLGRDNVVSRIIAPSPAFDAAWRQAREEATRAMDQHLADYTARLDQVAAAQQATAADVGRAEANLRADHTTTEALSRAVDDLSRQTNQLRAATAGLDGRMRATGLLTLSLRLRRDVDVGMPLSGDVAALSAIGPHPPALERSLQQLRRMSEGAPTMHDLANEFDRVVARIAVRLDATTSWASRGWSRLATAFGGAAQSGDDTLVDRLRALASEGRFSEAADVLQASNESDLGATWVTRVRTRATAVVATQALLSYSLVAYENAFAAAKTDAGGRLTQ